MQKRSPERKSHACQIELLGGPADGLRLAARQIPGRTIRLPSSPLPCQSTGYAKERATGKHWAMYERLWRKVEIDAGGLPLVQLGYNFVGYRTTPNPSQAKRLVVRLLRMTGLAWLKACTGHWRKALAARKLAAHGMAPTSERIENKRDTRLAATAKKRQRIRHP
jgi:hypothetical protein